MSESATLVSKCGVARWSSDWRGKAGGTRRRAERFQLISSLGCFSLGSCCLADPPQMRLRLLPLALQLRDIKVGAAAEDALHDRLVLTRDSLVLLPPMWRWKWFKHSAVSPPPSSHLFRVLRETWPALGFSLGCGMGTGERCWERGLWARGKRDGKNGPMAVTFDRVLMELERGRVRRRLQVRVIGVHDLVHFGEKELVVALKGQ